MEHRLKDNAVKVERDAKGAALGVAAECSCGWKSAGHFSGLAASAAFQHHVEKAK